MMALSSGELSPASLGAAGRTTWILSRTWK